MKTLESFFDEIEKVSSSGCVHVVVKDGRIQGVVTHLSGLPKNGVVHCRAEHDLSYKDLKRTHPMDTDDINVSGLKVGNYI